MIINTNAIHEINNCAYVNKEEVTVIGHVTVKRGGFEIRCHNFGIGSSFEEGMESLKRRCTRTDDLSDIVSVDVHTVYIGETFYMGDINAE